MIDSLCDQARGEDLAAAWLYCDFKTQQDQTTTNIIGAVLKQLVNRGEIPRDIREEFLEAKKVGGRRPLLEDLVRMLKIAVGPLRQVFICIDALDECLPENLTELLKSLGDFVLEHPWTRIFFTGRPPVREVLQRYFPKAAGIPISPKQDDIRNYVAARLNKDDVPEAMDNGLRVEIVKIILDKMSNMCVGVSPLSTMCAY